jgi:hypothetical protein
MSDYFVVHTKTLKPASWSRVVFKRIRIRTARRSLAAQ